MHDAEKPAITLRPPRPGDLGWGVSRHGALYAQECGSQAGYRLNASEAHHRFGQVLVGEVWEPAL